MKLLLDTNIVLDWWLDRRPFAQEAGVVFSSIESGAISGLLCATTLTTTHYLLQKEIGAAQARKVLGILLKIFNIASVNRAVLAQAAESPMGDFEDAVLCFSAQEAGAEAVVTRNEKDFRKAPIKIMNCQEVIHALNM